MEKRIIVKSETGKRVTAHVTDETIQFSGEERVQGVANDRNDYRYSHGGSLYQAACEKVWKLFHR